jgi:hypothetical protein
MNLPNYFLADLPPEAALTAATVTDACRTLKRNRAKYLANRSTNDVVELVAHVAAKWLRADSLFRKMALEQGPTATGFSRATLEHGLDAFFRQLTAENLDLLLRQELGEARHVASDGWQVTGTEDASPHPSPVTRCFWSGPDLIGHIAAGNIPNPALMSLVLGVLTRSAQFMKCATGTSFLPRLFAHSIYQYEPKVGACLEIAEWRGGDVALEEALFAEADCVTATGSDETLSAIRGRVPVKTRFVGYGHRVSFAYIARGMLFDPEDRRIAALAAADVVAWNQLGCLSPHVIYVERGGRVSPEGFAGDLAEELEKAEGIVPRGELAIETAAAIASRRAAYEVRAAHSPETRFWQSRNSTAWTVVYESDPAFQLSCLNRFVYVKSVEDLSAALTAADVVHRNVSTVGLAAPEDKAPALAAELARWGATRVCPLGQMQHPPLTWRHDGRPALGDLVTFIDWETGIEPQMNADGRR